MTSRGRCTLDANGTPCRYAVHAEDHAEPGAGADRFQVRLWSRTGILLHQANGLLGGGNIQVK